MSEFSWGVFFVVVAAALGIATVSPVFSLVLVAALAALLFAYRYPYFIFFAGLAFMPLLGLTVSIPTGETPLGLRLFGGSIDVNVSELIFALALVAWTLRVAILWWRRNDIAWRPSLPLSRQYGALVGAHLISALSPFAADTLLVFKYAARPVALAYAYFILLPVNLIRSRRRFMTALAVMSVMGTFAALNGLISLFYVDASSQFIRRAHPLPMFGVAALGDNHNLLAELLVVTVPLTLALRFMASSARTKRFLEAGAALQFLIGLLTFSRTGWIVFALEIALLAALEYRPLLKKHLGKIMALALLALPLLFIMAGLSTSNVASSSNDTRWALLEIAWGVFQSSPLFGTGAGTFVDRVGSSKIFTLEYGAPLDSHGILQKLAAETGALGLAAFAWVLWELVASSRQVWSELRTERLRRVYVMLMAAALGAIVYQLFNTNYWTGKMWLPVGLLLVAARVHKPSKEVDMYER